MSVANQNILSSIHVFDPGCVHRGASQIGPHHQLQAGQQDLSINPFAATKEVVGDAVDPRKQRRQHRRAAKALLSGGGLFNGFSVPGTTSHLVAQWHLSQARKR